jgi:hypothetical protein
MVMESKIIVKTTQFDVGATYHVGDYLTVKDLGGGEAVPTLATGTEPRLAKVIEVGDGFLTYGVL